MSVYVGVEEYYNSHDLDTRWYSWRRGLSMCEEEDNPLNSKLIWFTVNYGLKVVLFHFSCCIVTNLFPPSASALYWYYRKDDCSCHVTFPSSVFPIRLKDNRLLEKQKNKLLDSCTWPRPCLSTLTAAVTPWNEDRSWSAAADGVVL